MKLKTRQCDECMHLEWDHAAVPDSRDLCFQPRCSRGHKPRFYMPRFYLDDSLGFRRRCEDYKAASELNRKEGATP